MLELHVRGCADVEVFMAHSPWFIAGWSSLEGADLRWENENKHL